MRLKKTSLVAVMATVAMAAFFLQSAPPPPPNPNPVSYERFPPIPTAYWVQMLPAALPDGSNMIMRIHYVSDDTLPAKIDVYQNSGPNTFHDDGVGPDSVGGDGIYATYIREDITAFERQITAFEANLTHRGTFTVFTGHVGEEINEVPHFDLAAFHDGRNTPLSAHLINGSDCSTDLKKQNSLFITDLSVVEDLARTFNAYTDAGNPDGAWTFGHLIKNIVNSNATNAKKDFLKAWVKSYLSSRTVNGLTAVARPYALDFLITPWLVRASTFTGAITAANWENVWDNNTTEQNILKYAPFKLTAIVNRMDLRGNSAYSTTLSNSGETRFIYSLVSAVTCTTENGFQLTANTVPVNTFSNLSNTQDLLDWSGMNVILEFGNPQHTVCDAQDFARQWLDLSSSTYTLTDNPLTKDEIYNANLELITNTVTDAGAGGTARVNNSALNRIRTNERIFFPAVLTGSGTFNVFTGPASWANSDWELSQFELNAISHQLAVRPVTNTPQIDATETPNFSAISIDPTNGTTFPAITTNQNAVNAIHNWVFAHSNAVSIGNHNFNSDYSYTSNAILRTVKIATTALVTDELGHFWDWQWSTTADNNYPGVAAGASYALGRKLRQQFSLNTCQGCHSGENKTAFTHVRPLAYGQSANYWDPTTPANDAGPMDNRFVGTDGHSKVNGTLASVYPMLTSAGTSNTVVLTDMRYENVHLQRVSAFLTGRKYNGPVDYQDDKIDQNGGGEDNTDNDFDNPNSKYFVYDPADNHNGTNDNTRPKPDQVNGYNDLQMRKQDLCTFINLDCHNPSLGILILVSTLHIPKGID